MFALLCLAIVVAVLLIVDVAAMKWGVESRPMFLNQPDIEHAQQWKII